MWITVIAFFAFVFENSGIRTVFAGAIQTSLVFMIVMLSLVVLTGYTGQISLVQMSLAGVAAFFMARMMADGTGQGIEPQCRSSGPGLPWPLAALAGIAVAVLVGLLVGLPGGAHPRRATGRRHDRRGDHDPGRLPRQRQADRPRLRRRRRQVDAARRSSALDIGARSERAQNENPAFAIFEVVVLVLLAVAVANMRRSGLGRRFLSVRANERAAAAAGINVARTKLLAFGISAAIAGIGGVMLAFKQVEVSSANFPYTASLAVLAFAYLGGITSINGAIVGGMLVAGALAAVTSNYFYASTIEQLPRDHRRPRHDPDGDHPPRGHRPVHAGDDALRRQLAGLGDPRRPHAERGLRRPRTAGCSTWCSSWCSSAWRSGCKLLDDTIIDNNLAWALFSGVLAWLVLLAVASRLGPISPTFAEAGQRWASAAVRFGPTALVGYVLGWILFPLRDDQLQQAVHAARSSPAWR